MASKLHLETALLPEGWRSDVIVTVEHGTIVAIGAATDTAGTGAAEKISGVSVPGLPNVHSHAFQRAMAGLTEKQGTEADSFWTWRTEMYRFVECLAPDDLEAIAAQAYMEMLEAGFTSVAEFHYLHHRPDGRPYDNVAEMSERIVAAADAAGIGLCLLPVFYRQGGFLGKPASEGQRRFLNTRESYAKIMETRVPDGEIGIAPHSLRAVALDDLEWAATTYAGKPSHIHISEQTKEVDDCLAAHNKRPIDLFFDTIDAGRNWYLIHATHADAGEISRMARAQVVAGLCPITEANLGDGLFDMPAFLKQGGRFGVGSDSLVRISAADELRTLEYGQRLFHRRRNVLGDPVRSTGRALFEGALDGKALTVGQPADFVVLASCGQQGDAVLDSWIFAADNGAIRSVYRGGVPVVQQGRHRHRERIAARYDATLRRLLA